MKTRLNQWEITKYIINCTNPLLNVTLAGKRGRYNRRTLVLGLSYTENSRRLTINNGNIQIRYYIKYSAVLRIVLPSISIIPKYFYVPH